MLGNKKVILPIPTINKEDVLFLKELVEADKYKPVIDSCYPFGKIVEAFNYVTKGHKTENVVITFEPSNPT